MTNISKNKLILSLALIFVAGGVSGAVLTLGSTSKQSSPKPPSMERVCDHMKKRLQARLSLTDEQLTKISPVLEKTARELELIHRRHIRDVELVFEKSNEELALHLSPEQQRKLEEYSRERKAYFERSNKNRDGKSRTPPGRTND